MIKNTLAFNLFLDRLQLYIIGKINNYNLEDNKWATLLK